jgi:hypothetical protein
MAKVVSGEVLVLGKYQGTVAPILVRCNGCKYEWSPVPSTLFQGCGCPKCAEYGFQFNKPAITYYLRIATPDRPLYKIGITNRTVAKRFPRDMHRITILKIWNFDIGTDAYEYEQQVLRENAFDLYRGPDVLHNDGNDELFVCDVLGLDVNQPQLDFEFAA